MERIRRNANAVIYILTTFKFKLEAIMTVIGKQENGWMDELGFYVPSTVFQSFRDNGRVNMKGSVQ